jgi:hypothetical protein
LESLHRQSSVKPEAGEAETPHETEEVDEETEEDEEESELRLLAFTDLPASSLFSPGGAELIKKRSVALL